MPLAAKPIHLQLRAELEEMVLKDLLGPAGGETEIVTERNVRGRYVLGLLAPKGQTALPDDDDELTQSGTDTEDGKAEAALLKTATMLPSSIGLTFTVGKEAQALRHLKLQDACLGCTLLCAQTLIAFSLPRGMRLR